jgi:hypothetical protein
MREGRISTLLSVAVLVLAACAGRPPSPQPEAEAEAASVAFEIENQSSLDCAIYLIVDHISLRLGSVSTNAVLTVEKEWRQIGRGRHLRLRAEVVGSATRVVTDDLLVQPGQLVHWTLTPDLRMSNWAIY